MCSHLLAFPGYNEMSDDLLLVVVVMVGLVGGVTVSAFVAPVSPSFISTGHSFTYPPARHGSSILSCSR